MKYLIGAAVMASLALAVAVVNHFGISSDVIDPGLVVAMAVAQSSYDTTIREAVAGMPANMTNWDADTRNCETAAGIGFGLACGQGSKDKGAILGSTLANFVGISARDVTLVAAAGQTVDKYQLNDNMAVVNEGDWWVQTSVATSPTDPVHYDATTGVFAISGGSGPIVGARWMKSKASGLGLVRLSGHLPVP